MATKPTESITILSLRKLSLGTAEPQVKEPKTFTVEDAVETIGFGRFHIALFLIMGSTGVVEAMEIMLIAVVSPVIRCEWQLENWQVALVTTVFWLAGSLLIIGLASVVIPTIGWRWLIRIASIPGIILIMAFKFIPESARFNVSTGSIQAALATLNHIARMNHSVMPEGKLVEPVLEKRGRFADLLDAKYLRTTLQIWVVWLGISFAYYGVILASAELLERDLVCGSKADSEVVVTGGDSGESQSPCYCHMFAPSDYRTMIISTIGEIARLPHRYACFGDGNQRLPVSHWCNGGAIYIPAKLLKRVLFPLHFLPSTHSFTSSKLAVAISTPPKSFLVLMSASVLGALCLFSSVCVVCAISAFTLPIETKGRALQQFTFGIHINLDRSSARGGVPLLTLLGSQM
ncbi:hypothetical protein H8958_007183 [Nasalis larvatus]